MSGFDITFPVDAVIVGVDPLARQTSPPRRRMAAAAAASSGPAGPQPRTALSGPLAVTETVTDATPLQDARDPQRALYLPRYRLREETVSGRPRFQVTFAQGAEGFQLTVHLEHYPAPELGDAGRGAAPVAQAHEVVLAFTPRTVAGDVAVRKELRFQEVTEEATGLRATLRVTGLAERDAVYQAITEADRGASLTVRRTYSVATPAGGPLVRRVGEATRALIATAMPLQTLAMGFPMMPPDVKEYLQGVFACVERVGPLVIELETRGTVGTTALLDRLAPMVTALTTEAFLQMGLAMIQRTMPRPLSDAERAALRAHLALAGINDLTPIHAAADRLEALLRELRPFLDRYQPTAVSLPVVVTPAPFVFLPALHGYVFADLAQPAEGLLVREVQRGAQWVRYYQDWNDRRRFYYLPDRFALKPAAPPRQVQVSVERAGADQYLVQYTAVPVIATQRFDEDVAQLRRYLPSPDLKIELIPLAVDDPAFFLRVPRSSTAALWERQRRPGALGRTDLPIQDGLVVSTVDLAALINAMFSAHSTFFTGEVEIKIGSFAKELIPFDGRVVGGARDAVWDAIFDPKLTTDAMRIAIKVQPEAMARAGLSVVHVHFESGATVELTPGAADATLALRQPLRAFVLGTAAEQTYRYRVTLVHADGRPPASIPADDGWLTSTDTILRPRLTADRDPT